LNTIPPNVAEPLAILLYVTIVLFVIIVGFLLKLLLDTSHLVNSLQDFIKATQTELEPALREVHGTLCNINSISSSVNNQLNSINDGVEKGGKLVVDSLDRAGRRLKVVGNYARDGLLTILEKMLAK
jgi:predicted PurR-regulated permease PerM